VVIKDAAIWASIRLAYLRIFTCSAFLTARQGGSPAKIIFYVSGWPAWHRPAVVARSGWPQGRRSRNFLSLERLQSLFREVVIWFDSDCWWYLPCSRILHPVCGASRKPLLPGDLPFMVSRVFPWNERRKVAVFRDDYYRYRAWLARAGGLFTRRSVVRTPRNCDSTLIAPPRIVTLHGLSSVC
jgi:hypothetical protein